MTMAEATTNIAVSDRTARALEIMKNLNKAYDEFYKWMDEGYGHDNSTMNQCGDKWGDFLSYCNDYIGMEMRVNLCNSGYKRI